MRAIGLCFLLAFIAPLASADELTILKAARLFDARGDGELKDGMVVVEGTKIKAVGAGPPRPRRARTWSENEQRM